MNKTKIIASINQNTYQKGILEKMIINGADVVRLDMSYSDYKFCTKIIQEIEIINKELNSSISVMLDLEGPCIRTGKFKKGLAQLKTDDLIRIHADPIIGSEVGFSINYPNLIKIIKSHSIIKLSQGKVVLEVLEIGLDYLVCKVIQGGIVENESKLYIPGINPSRQFLTPQIKENIIFATKNNVDYLVLSNIVTEEDVLEVNDLLISQKNDHIQVLAKIDSLIAVNNLDRIIDVSDGILVSRNELAITTPIENIPTIKNNIVKKTRENGKISIIDTKLENPEILTRFEVSDIATTISLGYDAISLTTKTNEYSQDTFKYVQKIINTQEKNSDYEYFTQTALKTQIKNVSGTIISSAIQSSKELNCKAIIAQTKSGFTAKRISRFRPQCEIIAIVPNEKIAKSLNLYFGIIPVVVKDYTFENLTQKSKIIAEKIIDLNKNDKIIIIGSHQTIQNKYPNFMKIEEI